MRYAQALPGQRLHLVDEFGDELVATRALCGREPIQGWRMTINLPMGHACRNCTKIARSPNRRPRTYLVA